MPVRYRRTDRAIRSPAPAIARCTDRAGPGTGHAGRTAEGSGRHARQSSVPERRRNPPLRAARVSADHVPRGECARAHRVRVRRVRACCRRRRLAPTRSTVPGGVRCAATGSAGAATTARRDQTRCSCRVAASAPIPLFVAPGTADRTTLILHEYGAFPPRVAPLGHARNACTRSSIRAISSSAPGVLADPGVPGPTASARPSREGTPRRQGQVKDRRHPGALNAQVGPETGRCDGHGGFGHRPRATGTRLRRTRPRRPRTKATPPGPVCDVCSRSCSSWSRLRSWSGWGGATGGPATTASSTSGSCGTLSTVTDRSSTRASASRSARARCGSHF